MLGRVLASNDFGCRNCYVLKRASSSLLEKKAARVKRRKEKEKLHLQKLENQRGQKEIITPSLSNDEYSGSTLHGEKKDTQCPLPQTYSPKYTEACWYNWWEREGFFHPLDRAQDGNTYSMVIPPPNVTGKLHLGHALTVALEDVLCRWRRMRGDEVVWVPGCDHAGIATQSVVERLLHTKNLTRHDLGRDKFINEVWKWKHKKEEEIYDQLKVLGSSLDWSRTKFTLDPEFSRAVQEAFIRLHEDGTIYRKESLINWSCQLQSTISDIEIDNKEINQPTTLPIPGYTRQIEFGVMHTFDYPLLEQTSGDRCITVSTTRIETILGDTAIGVNPDDPRYSHLIGTTVRHPLIDGLYLPIVADKYVNPDTGTGAVKLTPGHDFNDFEVASRHSLPVRSILDDEGNITQCGNPSFDGMPRFEARDEIISALQNMGLYRGKEPHQMTLPICSRSGDVVEPRLKTQWFLRIEDLARKAIEAVETGRLQIFPETHVAAWNVWLTESSDWCISRQLWWGHRIPAYKVTNQTGKSKWISAASDEDVLIKAKQKYFSSEDSLTIEQDEDVLDTWFSSALFPFASFGWPDNTVDLNRFYPLSVMETGYDLLFFWVARMVMMGIALTDQVPFEKVYMHTMVRDSQGRKMSKSLGNVIDPLQVIDGCSPEDLDKIIKESNLPAKEEKFALKGRVNTLPNGIPECGTDSLRFYLLFNKNTGKDISIDVKGVMQYRFFCNKIWNVFKFLEKNVPKQDANTIFNPEQLRLVDKWILSRLHDTVTTVNSALDEFNFSLAVMTIYRYFLHDFADFYVETCKPVFNSTTGSDSRLAVEKNFENVFETFLRLLSPFMPFISEELWQRLPNNHRNAKSVMIANYPTSELATFHNVELEGFIDTVRNVIQIIRQMKQTYGVQASKLSQVTITCRNEESEDLLQVLPVIEHLGKCSEALIMPNTISTLPGTLSQNVDGKDMTVFLKVEGLIDIGKQYQSLLSRKTMLHDKISAIDLNEIKGRNARDKAEHKLRKLQASAEDVDKLLTDLKQLSEIA